MTVKADLNTAKLSKWRQILKLSSTKKCAESSFCWFYGEKFSEPVKPRATRPEIQVYGAYFQERAKHGVLPPVCQQNRQQMS